MAFDQQKFYDFFTPSLLNQAVNISLKNKFVFFSVPKTGSSTVDLRLQKIELLDLPGNHKTRPHPLALNSPFVKPYQLSKDGLSEILNDKNFFKFCFVRNPFSRVLSAYRDKILSTNDDYAAAYRVSAGFGKAERPSFDDFLEAISHQSAKRLEKHWGIQTHLSGSAFVDMDFVGKLEDFENSFDAISSRIGYKVERVSHRPHATNSSFHFEDHYTERTSQIVRDLYADDFAAFGYDDFVTTTT